MVIGSRLSPDSLGAINALKPESSKANKPKLLDLLTEPNSVVIDRSDMKRLGVTKEGDVAEVIGVRVKVVGFTEGVKSLAGPYVFCSINTARQLLRYPPDQVTYILGKTQRPEDAGIVAQRLQQEYGAKVPANGPPLCLAVVLFTNLSMECVTRPNRFVSPNHLPTRMPARSQPSLLTTFRAKVRCTGF
jgi:hypothetical protein